MSIGDFIVNNLETFLNLTGVAQCQYENLLMIAVGALFIWLAIKHNFEPLLLVPIGMGIIIGNIPFVSGMEVGLYEEGSVLNIFYQGVRLGWYPPLVFLGIGAMTDFSALISNPKLILIGAAAQEGTEIFRLFDDFWNRYEPAKERGENPPYVTFDCHEEE